MITKQELDNLERNFRGLTRHILTPKAYDTWAPIILELIEQARPAEPAEAESYTDTLNDLFPWGCETESEVITELVRRLNALDKDVRLIVALCNAHVRDTHDVLEERVERLKGETAEWIDALQGTDADLAARLDALTGLVEQETAYLDKGIELLDWLSNIVEAWVNIKPSPAEARGYPGAPSGEAREVGGWHRPDN